MANNSDKPVKIFITGMHSSQKHEFMYYLQHSIPQYCTVGRLTSYDPFYKECMIRKYYTRKETEEIFANRAFTLLHDGFGLVTSVLEENTLFCLSVEDFLLVPNKVYNNNDILVVWIDSDQSRRLANWESRTRNRGFSEAEKSQMLLMPQFQECLQGKNVMYFKDDSPIEMLARILQYLECDDPKKRPKLLDQDLMK